MKKNWTQLRHICYYDNENHIDSTELYNITGGSARENKCSQKHGGFWP